MTPARILVVEDNRDLAENVAELLEDEGHTVLLAGRGDEALAIAGSLDIGLAIIDVRLPDITGIELLSRLRGHLRDGEVIFMTGNASLDTAIAAVREGVFAYVQKPFDPVDLLAVAERALDQVRLRRERARLAHELERSEKLHRGIIETVDTLIIGIDRAGLVQMWNPAATRCTGHDNLAVLGESLAGLLFAEPERSEFAAWLARAWELTSDEITVEVRTASGGTRTVRWSQATLLRDGVTLLLLIGHDVSERLALERRAADAEAMASLATLTAGLAHEIRNPLNAAILQLELLSRVASRVAEERARERIGESVRLVQSEIRRLSHLLEEFLTLARPRSFELYATDLGAVIEHVVSMQRPLAELSGVAIHVDQTTGWPKILGDQSKMMQVFVNLVVNAIDANREAGGRAITITHEVSDDVLVIRVSDEGPGMPAEVASQIFRPFFSTKAQGTGLGLAIVKKIIDLHGGAITFGAREGGGTIAEVRLRRAPLRR